MFGIVVRFFVKELKYIHGFGPVPNHIALDADLDYKTMSTMVFDWMHCWCIDGVFKRTFASVMTALRQKTRTNLPEVNDVHAYMQLWTWPRQVAREREKPNTSTNQENIETPQNKHGR